MARYTLRIFAGTGGSEDNRAFEAFNDNDAITAILSLCDGRGLELWCDSRLVRAWNRTCAEAAES